MRTYIINICIKFCIFSFFISPDAPQVKVILSVSKKLLQKSAQYGIMGSNKM